MEKDYFMIDQLLVMWENKIAETTEIFEAFGAQGALKPVAPGKNRVIYLLGHLLITHDGLYEGLDLGNRHFAEYEELFLLPQHPANVYPSYLLLLNEWRVLHKKLKEKMRKMTLDNWRSKYHYISDEDFVLQPRKTKYGLLLCTITHLYHHTGQLALIQGV